MSDISYRGARPTRLQVIDRAGFWIRAVALAIDLVCIAILYVAIFVALSASNLWPSTSVEDQWAGSMFLLAIVLVYSSLEIACAGTPGKLLLKLRIRRQNSKPADGWRLLLRWTTKQSPWILMVMVALLQHPIFMWLQGLLQTVLLCGTLAAMNEDHLAWHDEWAGTAVWKVHRSAPVSLTIPSLFPT